MLNGGDHSLVAEANRPRRARRLWEPPLGRFWGAVWSPHGEVPEEGREGAGGGRGEPPPLGGGSGRFGRSSGRGLSGPIRPPEEVPLRAGGGAGGLLSSWRPLSVGFTMSFSAALATSLKSSVCVGLGKPRTAPADFSAGAHAALQSGHQRRWMCSRQSGLLFSSGKLKRIGHWSSPLRVTRRKTDPRCL